MKSNSAKQLLALDELPRADSSDPQVEVHPGDLSMLIYTGGTTGPPRVA